MRGVTITTALHTIRNMSPMLGLGVPQGAVNDLCSWALGVRRDRVKLRFVTPGRDVQLERHQPKVNEQVFANPCQADPVEKRRTRHPKTYSGSGPLFAHVALQPLRHSTRYPLDVARACNPPSSAYPSFQTCPSESACPFSHSLSFSSSPSLPPSPCRSGCERTPLKDNSSFDRIRLQPNPSHCHVLSGRCPSQSLTPFDKVQAKGAPSTRVDC